MNYRDLTCALENFPRIIVGGPNRAGTKIHAAIVAFELGCEWIEESETLFGANIPTVHVGGRVVYHLPREHSQPDRLDDGNTAFVMVDRPNKDIDAAAARWGWETTGFESKEERELNRRKLRQVRGDRLFAVWYGDWSDHPMWVPKEKRRTKAWGRNSTSL